MDGSSTTPFVDSLKAAGTPDNIIVAALPMWVAFQKTLVHVVQTSSATPSDMIDALDVFVVAAMKVLYTTSVPTKERSHVDATEFGNNILNHIATMFEAIITGEYPPKG